MSSPITALFSKKKRRIIGVMSGTSLDGIDVADVVVSGSGPDLEWEMVNYHSVSFAPETKEVLYRNSDPSTSSVQEITLLGDLIAVEYEAAIREGWSKWGTSSEEYDVVSIHGQTLFHQPSPVTLAGRDLRGTLQVGDPSILANRIEIPVVGDFRVADMALGGEGAPLVPYFDFVTFRDALEGRLLVNIGGISNVTVLPGGSNAHMVLARVRAFDCGPGNMILDALAERLLGRPYDEGGFTALSGQVHKALLAELLDHPFFFQEPPRSTGRELFSSAYVSQLVGRAESLGLSTADLFATTAVFTAETIFLGWERFVKRDVQLGRVLVSGGGVKNGAIMKALSDRFNPYPVESTAAYSVDPDAKEAVCFAILAHETLNGVATSLPGATGATRSTILGKICIPAT